MSDTELDEREQNAGQQEKIEGGLAAKELAALDQIEAGLQDSANDEIPYKHEGDDKPPRRRFFTPKKAAAGGTGGVIVGLIIAIFSILQGPGELAHFSHLLQNFHFFKDQSLMDSRAGNLIIYGMTIDDPDSRNLGFFGNIVADHYQNDLRSIGIEPRYENRRIRYLDVNINTPQGKVAYDGLVRRGLKVDVSGDGIATVDFQGTSARERRRVIGVMVDLLKINGASSVVAKRILRLRAAVSLHPLKNIVRRADESILQYRDRIRKERRVRRANGIDATPRTTTANPGDPDDETTQAGAEDRSKAAGEANEISQELKNPEGGSIADKTNTLRSRLSRGVGIAGIVALTCGLQQLGDAVYDIRDANINQPLMRIGTEQVAVGSQWESMQDYNLDMLGVYKDDLYDEETQTSWVSARSIQAQLGNDPTGPDLPDAAKPGYDRPAFFDVLDATIGKIPGGPAVCGGVTSAVGGFILDGAGWALNATGPIGFALNASTDVAIGAATAVFMDDVIKWLAGEQVVLDAAGALLGSQADYGAALAANDSAIFKGGVAMSDTDSALLIEEREQMLRDKRAGQSLFAKYLDLSDPDSLAAKVAYENTSLKSPSATIASVIKSPAGIFKNFARIFTPKAYAEHRRYDYGFPDFGFTLEELDDPLYEDSIYNASLVEPRLAALNDRYKKCFKTTVDPSTFKITTGKAARYDEIKNPANNCSNPGASFGDGTTELKRYRYYLADLVAAKSLACYESLDEESCNELGFGNEQGGVQSGSTSVPGDGFRGVDTSGQKCPAGSNDMGVKQVPTGEGLPASVPRHSIRLCNIPEIPSGMNVAITGNAISLIAAAKGSGLSLTGSSFRPTEDQVALRRQNCGTSTYAIYEAPSGSCSPETAKPGSSMHEQGLAIDFTNCGDRGSACFRWLSGNAEKYGFKNLPSEPWHWSTTGN